MIPYGTVPGVRPPQGQQDDQDFLSRVMKDPWFRLGMAMLEQGGPQSKPHSVGQDISRAVEKVQGQIDGDMAREMRAARLGQARDMQAQMSKIMEGAAPDAPPMQGAMMGSGMPTGAQMSMMAPQAALTPPSVASRIDPVANPSSEIKLTQRPVGRLRSSAIDERITKAARDAGVDPLLFRSLVQSESNFNHMDPRKGGITTSSAGALGAAQLMPGTAAELGVDPMDLDQNLDGGARYLAQQIKANGGDVREALRAYNAGPTGARRNPSLGGEYADTIMSRLPGEAAASAPMNQSVPMPQAPSAQTEPPPDVKQMLVFQAYGESGDDPPKFISAYYRLLNQWRSEQTKQSSKLRDDLILKDFEADRADMRDSIKTRNDLDNAAGIATNKGIGEAAAKRFNSLQDAGTAAQMKIDRLNLLQDMLNRGYQGYGGEAKAQLVRIGAALGFEGMDQMASAADVVAAIQNQMALSFRSTANGEGMPGAMSDADRQFLMSLPPGFEKTPAGNRILIEFYKRVAKREQEAARMARAYSKRMGGSFDYNFEDELLDYYMKNPLFKNGEVKKIMGVKVSPEAVQELRNRIRLNPKAAQQERALFDAEFWEGASQEALGGK